VTTTAWISRFISISSARLPAIARNSSTRWSKVGRSSGSSSPTSLPGSKPGTGEPDDVGVGGGQPQHALAAGADAQRRAGPLRGCGV
jgi:hypothetical protein